MEKTLVKKETIHAKGEYTVSTCDTSSPKAKEMVKDIESVIEWGRNLVASSPTKANIDLAWKTYREKLAEFHKLFLVKQVVYHNKVVDRGTEMLARIVSGDTTYTGIINYCALGTGTAAGAAGDTQLGTETFRKLVSSKTYSANQAFISTFFTAVETTGTYGEVGHFVDGTGTANSGRLFSRIGDPDTTELTVTKSASETLTIDYKVTFTG